MSTVNYEFLLRAYTEESIPRRSADPFMVADLVGHLLSLTGGDGSSTTATTTAATAAQSSFLFSPGDRSAYWQGQPNFRSIPAHLGFIRLSGGGRSSQNVEAATGTGSPVSGSGGGASGPAFFYLKPIARPLNAQIGTETGTALNGVPSGSTAYDLCPFDVVSGHWETWLPDNSKHTRVAAMNHVADQAVEARTRKPFEANRQYRFDLAFFGTSYNATQDGAARVIWGEGTYSFVWRKSASPVIERFDGNTGEWRSWHTLEGAPVADFTGDWTLYVQRLNGSLVVRLEGQGYKGQWDFADVLQGEDKREARLVDVSWPRGRVSVRAFNVQLSFGIVLLDHATTDLKTRKKKPFSATFERDCPRPATMSTDLAGVSSAIVTGKTGGWNREGTKTSVILRTLPPSQDTGDVPVVRYTCTLTASPDGLTSPCVSLVYGGYEGAFTDPTSPFLDITPAALKGSLSSAEPPTMAGAELRLDLSRNLLEQLTPTWYQYVHSFHPIELAVRRRYRDGTASPWRGRFKGYILDSSRDGGINEWNMSLVCESDVKRLQKPHALCDYRYYPLDLLFARGDGRRLFVPQCVKEIVRIASGDAEAARFNGNGDALRFLSPDHPPLINTLGDCMGLFPLSQPLAQNDFTFKVPYDDGPLDWIKTLNGYDRTLTFYEFLPETGESDDDGDGAPIIPWPVPICGRYEQIVSGRPTHRVADAIYLPGDEDSALSSVSSRFHADSVYNKFVMRATPPGASHPLLPSLLTAEEYLPASDPNSAARSWERTLVVQDDWLYKAGGVLGHPLAALVASVFFLRREFQDKDWRLPTLGFRGLPEACWGDKIKPERLNILTDGPERSDPTVLPQDAEYRVLGIDETYNFNRFGPEQYITTAKAAPLSSSGF